jgi:transposase
VLNADETSFSLEGIKAWGHVLATPELTCLAPHRKRGRRALDAIGLLKGFTGTVTHDCFSMYFFYGTYQDSLCLVHIIRELKDPVEEGCKQAEKLINFFLELKDEVDASDGALLGYAQKKWLRRFRGLRTRAWNELDGDALKDPDWPPAKGPRLKRSNLLDRLDKNEDAALSFMTDPGVAFSNNEAARSLRVLKVVMKVSGCFRSPELDQVF